MGRRKSDIFIGQRAAEEVNRICAEKDMRMVDFQRLIGIDKKNVYSWRDGGTPNSFFLQKLLYAGADIRYILTGRRECHDPV